MGRAGGTNVKCVNLLHDGLRWGLYVWRKRKREWKREAGWCMDEAIPTRAQCPSNHTHFHKPSF